MQKGNDSTMEQNGKGIGCIGIFLIFVIIVIAISYWWLSLIIIAIVIFIAVAVQADKKKKQAAAAAKTAMQEALNQQKQMLTRQDEDGLKGYIANCLRLTGYTEIYVTPKSLAGGADITGIAPDGRKCIFRCAAENAALDASAVMETAAAEISQGASEACIASRAGFTEEAYRTAAEKGITLYDREGIEKLAVSAARYGLS